MALLASVVLWSEDSVCTESREHVREKPRMTIPIKKRIDTGLFIDRMTALYLGETQIRAGINEGDQSVGTC